MTTTGTPDATGHEPHPADLPPWPTRAQVRRVGAAAGRRCRVGGAWSTRSACRPVDRIVDLAPGTGEIGLRATEQNLYAWTGICRDEADADQLRADVPSPVTFAQLGRRPRPACPTRARPR